MTGPTDASLAESVHAWVQEAVRPSPSPFDPQPGWEPTPAWNPAQARLHELVREEIKRSLAHRPLGSTARRPSSANIDTPPVGFTAHSGTIPGIASLRQP